MPSPRRSLIVTFHNGGTLTLQPPDRHTLRDQLRVIRKCVKLGREFIATDTDGRQIARGFVRHVEVG